MDPEGDEKIEIAREAPPIIEREKILSTTFDNISSLWLQER